MLYAKLADQGHDGLGVRVFCDVKSHQVFFQMNGRITAIIKEHEAEITLLSRSVIVGTSEYRYYQAD